MVYNLSENLNEISKNVRLVGPTIGSEVFPVRHGGDNPPNSVPMTITNIYIMHIRTTAQMIL